jgi:hypothetical protein
MSLARPASKSAERSAAREMPESISRGPAGASTTLAGLRSPWTTPAAWAALSASASPAASVSTEGSGSGP